MKLTKDTCYYVNVEGLTMVKKLNLLRKIKRIFGDDIRWGGNPNDDILVYDMFPKADYDNYFVIYYYHEVHYKNSKTIMRPCRLHGEKNLTPLKFNNLKDKLK